MGNAKLHLPVAGVVQRIVLWLGEIGFRKMKEVKVLIVDDKEVAREGLARLLDEQETIKVVYQCDSEYVVAAIKQCKPDLILMEAELSKREAAELISQIAKSSPDAKVAMLTDCVDKDKLFACLESGARGYLIKNLGVQELIASINLIASGRIVISPMLANDFLKEVIKLRQATKLDETQGRFGLSKRETEILELIGKGYTNKEIAQKLVVAENTVKVHVKNILNKLGLRNRQQAAAYAAEFGLVSVQSDDEAAETNDDSH